MEYTLHWDNDGKEIINLADPFDKACQGFFGFFFFFGLFSSNNKYKPAMAIFLTTLLELY